MFLRKLLGSLVVAASLLKYRYSGVITPSNTLNESLTVLQSTEPNCTAVSDVEFHTEGPLSRLSSVLTTSLATLGLTSITPTRTTSPVLHCSSTPTAITNFDAEPSSYLSMSPTSATRHLPRSPWGFPVYIASASALLSAVVWIVAALSVMWLYSSLILYSLRCVFLYTVQTMWAFVMRKVLRVPAKVPIGDYIRLDQQYTMLAQQLSLLQAGKAASDSANSDLTYQLASLQAQFDLSIQAHIALVEAKDTTIGATISTLDQEIKKGSEYFRHTLDLMFKCRILETGDLEKDARISLLSSQLDSTRATVKQLGHTVKGLEDTVAERDGAITNLTAQILDVKMQAEAASVHHATMLEIQEAEVDALKEANLQLQAALSAALERASALSIDLEQTRKGNEAEMAAQQENQRRLKDQVVELINDRETLTKLLEQARTENHSLAKQYKSLLDEDDIMIAGLMCQLQDMVNERSEGVINGWDNHEDEANLIIPSIVIHPPPDMPTGQHTSEDPVAPVQSSSGDGRQIPPVSGPAQEESLREVIEESEERLDPDVTVVDAEELHDTQRFMLGVALVPGARASSPDDTLVNTSSDVDNADDDDIDYIFEPGSPQWEHVRLQLPDTRQEDKAVLDALDGQLELVSEMPKIFATLACGHEDYLDCTSDPDDGCSSEGVENDHVRELYRSDVADVTAIDHEEEAKLGNINSQPANGKHVHCDGENNSRPDPGANSDDEDLDTPRADEEGYLPNEEGCTPSRERSEKDGVDYSPLGEGLQERD